MGVSPMVFARGGRVRRAMADSVLGAFFGGIAGAVVFVVLTGAFVGSGGEPPRVGSDFLLVGMNLVPIMVIAAIASFVSLLLPGPAASAGYALVGVIGLITFGLGSVLFSFVDAPTARDYAYLGGVLIPAIFAFGVHWLWICFSTSFEGRGR